MKTSQLKKALTRHHQTQSVFGGVYARDKVPTAPKGKTVAYVVNTDKSNQPGQHWVVFYYTPHQVKYFDPYGRPPQGFQRLLGSRTRKQYFKRRLQGLGRMCGHYCLYFILTQCSHLTLCPFGRDYNANDRYVKRMAEMHFAL